MTKTWKSKKYKPRSGDIFVEKKKRTDQAA